MTARRHDADAPTRVAGPDELAGASAEPGPVSGPGSPYAPDEIVAGKYLLLELLGQGGMGSVWKALNTQLETEVAIKLLRGDSVSDESRVRLEQEARVSARIDHPGVVRVFDLGRSERGDPFIVMELLRGRPLSALIAQGPIEPRRAAALLLPVAAALVRAHGLGVVHRDLKPDNVFLVEGDAGLVQPKIVDFGIARLNDPVGGAARVTRAGVLVGSPGYMAPEQARGRSDVDERADVWALAVLIYESVSGRECFQGETALALLSAVLEEEPRPFAELGVGDDQLWAIVRAGLAKKREERTQTVRELGRALAEWAVACGLEEDAAGVSIRRSWLDEGSRSSLEPRSSAAPSQSPLAAAKPSPPRVSSAPVQPRAAGAAAEPAAVLAGAPPSDRDATSTTLTTPSGPQPVPPGLALPAPRRGPVAVALAAAVGAVALWLVGSSPSRPPATAVLSLSPVAPSASNPGSPSEASASASAGRAQPAASTPSAASASASASASAPASAPASAEPPLSPPPRPAPGGELACLASVFPEGTFPRSPRLSPVCRERDARKASEALKSEIIRGGMGHKPTEAMREWAVLGWYEMAALAAVRGRCCPSPVPLSLSPPPGRCERPERALAEIERAIAEGKDVGPAIARYTADASCVAHAGAGARFGLGKPLSGGERASLDKLVSRLR